MSNLSYTMKFLYTAFIILHFFINCEAYNRMFLSICKAVFSTLIQDSKYISMKPIRNISNVAAKDVSLVIFKGNHIKANKYIGISNTIQKIGNERGLNIDIKIPHYPYAENFKQDKTPTFVLGHSSGVYDFLMFHNASKYDGLIQVGSVLNSNGKLPWKSRKLETFPIPILTLIGKKDGYLRHTYCLDELYKQIDDEKYSKKPILIINDITHLHISNTSSSVIAEWIGLKDLKSIIDVEKAWNMLGECIVDFIILNIDYASKDDSLMRIKDIQNKTQNLLTTYLKFENVNNIKKLLNILQNILKQSTNNEVYFLNFYDFLLSKPNDTVMYFYIPSKNYLFSKMYYQPLWIKTKYKRYMSAKDINKCLFWQIAKMMKTNTNLNIVFRADKICSTTLEWLISGVKIERIGDTIYVQSPIFITNQKTIIYQNYYYLKILSPAQIIELINIDLQDE